MSTKKPLIEKLASDELRVSKDLAFTATCKNTGKTHSYYFGGRPRFQHLHAVTGVFVWAMYKRRHGMGHVARVTGRELLWKFLRFLDEEGITHPHQLNRDVQAKFVYWLKNLEKVSYATAGANYRTLSPYFKEMCKHSDVSKCFWPIRNAFPKSSSLQAAGLGYDEAELKAILRAAGEGLKESMKKLNAPYVRRWKDKPAPLEDVAPKGNTDRRSFWFSLEYKIWWWENNCGCQRLNSSELSRLPQGQGFITSFANSEKTGMAGVNEFYDSIGAGNDYVPKYIGKPSPIKYLTPWKKMDYLVWYWENVMDCEPVAGKKLKKIAPDLYRALGDNFNGRIEWFYKQLGVSCWISAQDLVPFYLMLLIRTQLNPSTLQRLTVDCIEADPMDAERQRLRWVKYRSMRVGHTISSDASNDEWPVKIIAKVIQVTERFRPAGQKSLWISNSNNTATGLPLGNGGFTAALKTFSQKHQLRHSSGEPLIIQGRLIRPTIAMLEYLRTESLPYLQVLLSHAKAETTVGYLRRGGDKVMKMRRSLHQEAMLVGLTNGLSVSSAKLGSAVKDGILNHCKDPLRPPIGGQNEGSICSASHEVCLSCPNLVITLQDIKKFFCFMTYHEQLHKQGVLSEDEFRKATDEKKYVWETQILPRYGSEVIQAVRADALSNPLAAWPKLEEINSGA